MSKQKKNPLADYEAGKFIIPKHKGDYIVIDDLVSTCMIIPMSNLPFRLKNYNCNFEISKSGYITINIWGKKL